MKWTTRFSLLLAGFVAGNYISASQAQYDPISHPPFGFTSLQMAQLMFQQAERDHQREAAERELNAKLDLRRRAEKLSTLYDGVKEAWQAAIAEQQKQLEQKASGVVDIRQDVMVAKLTQEMADKAAEIAKLNKVKR